MKKPIYIFGAGGLGREVLALIRQLDIWEAKGFVDDGITPGNVVNGLTVMGGTQFLRSAGNVDIVVAIGDPLVKERIVREIPEGIRFPILIHPSANIVDLSSVTIGEGSIITAGTILTCDISIGKHVLLNLNSTVGHDCEIGAYSSIMPGVNIAGDVKIGEAVLLGSGSNIRNGVRIGGRSQVGMGAVVLKDVSPGLTVVGVPARAR